MNIESSFSEEVIEYQQAVLPKVEQPLDQAIKTVEVFNHRWGPCRFLSSEHGSYRQYVQQLAPQSELRSRSFLAISWSLDHSVPCPRIFARRWPRPSNSQDDLPPRQSTFLQRVTFVIPKRALMSRFSGELECQNLSLDGRDRSIKPWIRHDTGAFAKSLLKILAPAT